jgi:hypothetical protein
MKLEKGRVYRQKNDSLADPHVADGGGWLWVCEETTLLRDGLRIADPRFRSVATGATMWLMSPETWLEEAEDEAEGG